MISWKRALLGAVVVLGVATGCGSGDGGASQGASSSQPPATTAAQAPFAATVSLADFSATCREVACWLPTQFAPKLVKGDTVGLRETWPLDGTSVQVVCETTGEAYTDQTGQSTTAWYGIAVPDEDLDPGAKDKATRTLDGKSSLGYVGAAWVEGGAGKQAPAC